MAAIMVGLVPITVFAISPLNKNYIGFQEIFKIRQENIRRE